MTSHLSVSLSAPSIGAATVAASDTIDIRLFPRGADRREIFRLRYRAYLEAKLISPMPSGLFSDVYDDMETSKTVGAFCDGVCVGSLRLAFGLGGAPTPTMPCQSVFGEVPALTSKQSGTLVEFTRIVVDPTITNNSFRATLYGSLVRAGMVVAKAGSADLALIAVMPIMMPFYKRMCGFKFVAGPRPYPGVEFATNLMSAPFKGLDAERNRRNRFFATTAAEVAQARTLFDR